MTRITYPVIWPIHVRDISYRSQADGTEQHAMFYGVEAREPRPLLVALHTWSYDYTQADSAPYATWCIAHGWAMIHPDFRGPNHRPEAGGSDLAVQDVLDAIAYAKEHAAVDERRIYLAGVSGGGHMALLMAGRAPELWAGVSAWSPIADLAAWHAESRARSLTYADDLEACCGGEPGASDEVDRQYALRSPLSYLTPAIRIPIDVNAGIRDGHTGSVPVSHVLAAFNALAAVGDRVSERRIREMVENAAVPAALAATESDPRYGDQRVLFRRSSGNARVTLFDGGHEIIMKAALEWLAEQVRNAD